MCNSERAPVSRCATILKLHPLWTATNLVVVINHEFVFNIYEIDDTIIY